MSHEIIKSISIVNNKVFITSCSNNVHPRIPYKWECESLTKILVNEGHTKLDRTILIEFMNGNFASNSTLYGKVCSLAGSDGNIETVYNNYVKHKRSRKCIVRHGQSYFIGTTARRAFLNENIERAKCYKEIDALILCQRFPKSEIIYKDN